MHKDEIHLSPIIGLGPERAVLSHPVFHRKDFLCRYLFGNMSAPAVHHFRRTDYLFSYTSLIIHQPGIKPYKLRHPFCFGDYRHHGRRYGVDQLQYHCLLKETEGFAHLTRLITRIGEIPQGDCLARECPAIRKDKAHNIRKLVAPCIFLRIILISLYKRFINILNGYNVLCLGITLHGFRHSAICFVFTNVCTASGIPPTMA